MQEEILFMKSGRKARDEERQNRTYNQVIEERGCRILIDGSTIFLVANIVQLHALTEFNRKLVLYARLYPSIVPERRERTRAN